MAGRGLVDMSLGDKGIKLAHQIPHDIPEDVLTSYTVLDCGKVYYLGFQIGGASEDR